MKCHKHGLVTGTHLVRWRSPARLIVCDVVRLQQTHNSRAGQSRERTHLHHPQLPTVVEQRAGKERKQRLTPEWEMGSGSFGALEKANDGSVGFLWFGMRHTRTKSTSSEQVQTGKHMARARRSVFVQGDGLLPDSTLQHILSRAWLHFRHHLSD